jgi:L-amino acid N-acyltransferase YncA/2-polyprenyl-3-methyl-5-hydroxy-6-metoxy-1,4-benzoquinol methylase
MSDHSPDGREPAGPRSREQIVARYSELARQAIAGGCLDAGAYAGEAGLPDDALRASLGCGNPLAVADIAPGETVLDLGSGGGLDVILSARRAGPAGRAYGLDASAEMIALATENARRAGAGNVEFLRGHLEDIPLPDGHVDVVISNCVINLSTDKPAALAEAFRVLRAGGRLGITDVIADDDLDTVRRRAAEEAVGCAAGTVTITDYRAQLRSAGFTGITISVTQRMADGLSSAIVRAAKPAAPPGVVIRPMRAADADQVLAVYQAGIDTGDASFETSAPSWEAFDAGRLPDHRYVAVDAADGTVLGWVAASAVSARRVYAGVVQHSVYVLPAAGGRGIGRALLDALIGSTEAAEIWTIQSGVFPENAASLALHERAGFRTVGVRERIGRHHGRWRDVVFIERRSAAAGND